MELYNKPTPIEIVPWNDLIFANNLINRTRRLNGTEKPPIKVKEDVFGPLQKSIIINNARNLLYIGILCHIPKQKVTPQLEKIIQYFSKYLHQQIYNEFFIHNYQKYIHSIHQYIEHGQWIARKIFHTDSVQKFIKLSLPQFVDQDNNNNTDGSTEVQDTVAEYLLKAKDAVKKIFHKSDLKCAKCSSVDVKFWTNQRRSPDEPADLKYKCLNPQCNNVWNIMG